MITLFPIMEGGVGCVMLFPFCTLSMHIVEFMLCDLHLSVDPNVTPFCVNSCVGVDDRLSKRSSLIFCSNLTSTNLEFYEGSTVRWVAIYEHI